RDYKVTGVQTCALPICFAIDVDFPTTQIEDNVFDFTKFAEAFGGWGERVTDPNQISAAFRRALASEKPAIVDVIVQRDADASMEIGRASCRERGEIVEG